MSDPEKNDPGKPYDFLQYIFFMMVIFTGFLFVIRPPQVPAQLVFRGSILVIGVVGLVVLQILRARPR